MKNDKHEFRPGGNLDLYIEEPNTCRVCGKPEEHDDHLDESGEPFIEWGVIDRIRADGSLAPE